MRKYSAILGNLGNTRDRFCSRYKDNPSTMQMFKNAAAIESVKGLELVGTWDISSSNVDEMKKVFEDSGLRCVSIIPDLFTDKIWANGSISAKDKKTRENALVYLRQMCEISIAMNCGIINLWPGQDGYDYPLQADFMEERKHLIENIAVLASEFPSLKIALEYKAKEPRTHSYLARMADTLLVCLQTGMPNVGVTIDTGHAFLGGENVAEAVVLAKQAGNRLFHMHFNDNYKSWDDDMIAGSVHSIDYIELLYWLDESDYDGWFSIDLYPYREDAADAISESIKWLRKFDETMIKNRKELENVIKNGNAVESSRLLRSLMFR